MKLDAILNYTYCVFQMAKELQLDFLESGLRGSKLASFNH